MALKAVIIGALDTKGMECKYLKDLLEEAGLSTITINIGVLGEPYYQAEISSEAVAEKAGTRLSELISRNDRGAAVEAMMHGAIHIVSELYRKGELGGIIGLGGSAGTTISTAAMRMLPVGLPKVMISTIASGDVRQYVGMKDITMVNSIVDISGLNRISRRTLANGAFSLIGMMNGKIPVDDTEKPIVAVTMFGVTTACVTAAREYLEQHGYEVLAFHATGIGGQVMESLIESGLIAGVLDITTTEIADEVAGGMLSAGPDRLEAAGRAGIPQVVSVGAMDMANFVVGIESVPERYRSRQFVKHNPHVTLMRTNAQENREIGEWMADKLNRSRGQTTVYLPLKGVSALDQCGQPFFGPSEDEALFEALRHCLNTNVDLIEMDCHINDMIFATSMAEKLLDMISAKGNREE